MSGNWFDDHSLLSSYRTQGLRSDQEPGGGDFNYLYPYFHDLVIKVKNESSLKFYFYIFGEKKNKSFPKDGN